MSAPLRIAASILSSDFGYLAEEVKAAEAAGADWIHVDVMDGCFVPNLTLGPIVVEAVRRATKLPIDVHLMIVHPERFIDAFAKAGANWVSVHAEGNAHLHRLVQQIRNAGAHPSLVLNPATPLSAAEELLGDVDMVLLMSVNPGFAGQAFIPGVVDKVKALRARLDATLRKDVLIEVDGGVNSQTAPDLVRAGANVLVAGTAVFGEKDYAKAISALRA
ncbi:MAG: ribulose-phosphate 3-epimerase [Myxococcaceae bacterium]